MRVFVAIAFCFPLEALSFVCNRVASLPGREPNHVKISSQDLRDVLSDELMPQERTGLWLDLRSTVIHPKAAIEQLELETGLSSFVDMILLSERVFQNLVDSNDMYLTTSQIMYKSSETDDIFLSSNRGLSTPFGNVLNAPSDASMPVEDPMQAIDLISTGKWLVLGKEDENTDENSESLRIESVRNFLDIVSSSSGIGLWDSSPEASGLVLPRTETLDDSYQRQDKFTSEKGGVAVICETKAALMELASILQLRQTGYGDSVTESGIILHSSENISSDVNTAVVLPFSIDLWRVATLVFGKEFSEEISEDFE